MNNSQKAFLFALFKTILSILCKDVLHVMHVSGTYLKGHVTIPEKHVDNILQHYTVATLWMKRNISVIDRFEVKTLVHL